MPIRSITWSGVRREISQAYTAARIKSREFIPQYGLLASDHVALFPFLLAIPISLNQIFLMMGCWEHRVELDVANMARQKIFKKLTSKEEFREIINEAEDALQEEVKNLLSRLRQGEGKTFTPRMLKEYIKNQQELIETIVDKVWRQIEPKIQDIEQKQRFQAWLKELKSELSGVSKYQELAKITLNTTMKDILDNFRDKLNDLNISLLGEIDEDGTAMHTLAEVVVEKMLHSELDFEKAAKQIVNYLFKAGVIPQGVSKGRVLDLLKESMAKNNQTLKTLFEDFRTDFLDPGPGSLLSVLEQMLELPPGVTQDKLEKLNDGAMAVFNLELSAAIEDIVFDEADSRIEDAEIKGKSISQLILDEVLLGMLGELDPGFAPEVFKEDFLQRAAKAIKETYFKNEKITMADLLEIIKGLEVAPGKNLAQAIVDWINKNRIFDKEVVEEGVADKVTEEKVAKEDEPVGQLERDVEEQKAETEKDGEVEFAFEFEEEAESEKDYDDEEHR